eukprot:1788571-Rhodomonas_salina.1
MSGADPACVASDLPNAGIRRDFSTGANRTYEAGMPPFRAESNLWLQLTWMAAEQEGQADGTARMISTLSL